MQRNLFVSAAAILALTGAILLGSSSHAHAADTTANQITIDNFSFSPATINVKTGTEVTWVNHDDIPHTVVSDDKTTVKSRPLDTDEKFTFKFDKPGTYNYFCSIHPKMTGKVVVQ